MLAPEFLARPIAHRALHDEARPENSRAAIEAAIEYGYCIEIDVQASADHAALVFHDYDLGRLTGARGPVRARTRAELADIRLAGGEKGIPDLVEVLDIVGGKVPVLVEIKDQDGALGEGVGPLEAAVAQAFDGYPGPLAVMSFNSHSVARMAELCPDVPRGLTTGPFHPDDWPVPQDRLSTLAAIPDYARTGACFISHNCRDLDRPRVSELKEEGTAVLCWTVCTPEEEAEARQIADNITFEGYLAPHTP